MAGEIIAHPTYMEHIRHFFDELDLDHMNGQGVDLSTYALLSARATDVYLHTLQPDGDMPPDDDRKWSAERSASFLSPFRVGCRLRQFDGAPGRDVRGELAQPGRGQAHPQGRQATAQRGVDLDGGSSPVGACQGAQHGGGVATSLLFHLPRHADPGGPPARQARARPGRRRHHRGSSGGGHHTCTHATQLPDAELMFETR
jgi:hypothetical protein